METKITVKKNDSFRHLTNNETASLSNRRISVLRQIEELHKKSMMHKKSESITTLQGDLHDFCLNGGKLFQERC